MKGKSRKINIILFSILFVMATIVLVVISQTKRNNSIFSLNERINLADSLKDTMYITNNELGNYSNGLQGAHELLFVDENGNRLER